MKPATAVVLALALTGAIAALALRPSTTDAVAPADLAASPVAAPPAPAPAAAPVPAGAASARAEAPAVAATPLLELIARDYRWEPGNPSNEAESAEDAAWLTRAGFPDPGVYHELRRATMEELEEAARTDLRAQVVFAYRLAMAGNQGSRPLELLQDAAARGSVFALTTWGDVHYQLPAYRNPALGNAYYRLAYRRGYFNAAVVNYTFARSLTAESRLIADAFAEAAWVELLAARRQLGLPPFAEGEMRPGHQQFLARLQAEYAQMRSTQ